MLVEQAMQLDLELLLHQDWVVHPGLVRLAVGQMGELEGVVLHYYFQFHYFQLLLL
tara:strand:+ start:323 stop:490 length:168 start_codon:yes stop_codon:yes gene_type:complete